MSKLLIRSIVIIGILAIFAITIASSLISFSNTEVDLVSRFKQKTDERTAFYDNMWKTIAQKGKIALKNDSSFTRNVNAIMTGRADAPQVFMKWVQETNPNANFDQVTLLYADLSRAVEGKRDAFFMQEKMMQDIVLQHDNLLGKFPGSLWNSFFNREHLVYKPITSDRTDDVMRTGKDNDIELF